MARNEHAIEIARPPEAVFPYLTEPELLMQWVGGLTEFTPLDAHEAQPGARSRQKMRVAGRDWTFGGEVLELEPGRRIVVEIRGRGVEIRNAYALEEANGGTRLRVSVETTVSRLFARVLGSVVAREGQRKLEGDLARLKELVEAEPS
ncbi:MAG TPA: SRPBCC family protein [Gaiellaceae bacterium]